MNINRTQPPLHTQLLWVENLPDVTIETQVIYVLIVSHEDTDIRQTLYSMWTYDNDWHLLGGDNIVAISITQEQYTLLVTNNALIPGQQYVIQDLRFEYLIGGTDVVDSYVEPLMVTALTSNKLQPIAYPINYPNDWVEVDWSIPAITFRHDTLLNNHIGYDYRNKLNRRYKLNIENVFVPNVIFDDWVLPSIDALQEMHTHLYEEHLAKINTGSYMSSTETDATQYKAFNMDTGTIEDKIKTDNTTFIRPIRSFTIIEAVQTYYIGDLGPTHNYIFAITDNLDGSFTYYEVAPTDIPSNVFDDVHLLIGSTLSTIESSSANTNAIVSQIGFTTGGALDCLNHLVNSEQYAQGDIVINEDDDIYIALRNNVSTSLSDGNWFKFPFKNNTYSGSGETDAIVIYDVPYDISSDVDDYKDVLTFLGNVKDVTTGSDFLNNVFQGDMLMCKFGEDNSYITGDGCANITVGDGNSYLWIKDSFNVKIGNYNYNFYFDTIINVNIGNDNTVIGLPIGTNNINIGNVINELISSGNIINSVFESNSKQFINTTIVDNLHVKPNVNLRNHTGDILNILPLGFHKTIENMYHLAEDVKPMLYYYDADSSLPILVEIQ